MADGALAARNGVVVMGRQPLPYGRATSRGPGALHQHPRPPLPWGSMALISLALGEHFGCMPGKASWPFLFLILPAGPGLGRRTVGCVRA